MTPDHQTSTPPARPATERSERVTCPVCDGTGTRTGVWIHLRYSHDWPDDHIREAIGPPPGPVDGE